MSDSVESIPTASQEGVSSDNEKAESLPSLPPSEDGSIASESTKSESGKTESKASKIAKPTGLKLPTAGSTASTASTRIGRPCCNVPKPAIPPNPAKSKIDFLFYFIMLFYGVERF